MQYRQAYLDAIAGFGQKDPAQMAALSGGEYISGEIQLSYCGQPCRVKYPSGVISVEGWTELPHEEQIIILQYMAGASGLPPRGRWLSFLELPGGPHHFAPFQLEAIHPLARTFGRKPEAFLAAALQLGGTREHFGHAGAVIPALPRISLGVVLWTEDDEFPATANILFDASAETYLPTASLYMLGIAVSGRMQAAGKG